MDIDLRDLLRNVANDTTNTKNDAYTHLTYFGPHNRWTIPPHNLATFWQEYCDLVDRKTYGRDGVPPDPFANLCLAERPTDVMPQIAQFTFRFHADETDNRDNWEPYDDDFLQYLCHVYQTVLSENFRIISETNMELVAVILESSTHWYEEDTDANQRLMIMEVRIHFPYGRLDASMQNKTIRPRVIQMLRNNNAMNKLQRAPIGEWEQIIAYTSTDLPIQLLGSSEIQGRPKLEITHIWGHITADMIENGDQPENFPLEDAFIPSNHSHVQACAIQDTMFTDIPNVRYWAPMFLSLSYWQTVMLPHVADNGRFAGTARPVQPRVFGSTNANASKRGQDNFVNDDEMELADQMIQMISPTRFLNESYWLDIGKAFYNSDDGGDNGLLAWTRHTEKAITGIADIPAYMKTASTLAETCRNLYYTFANSYITVKTLAWYARDDSAEKFGNWHKDWCATSMEKALSALHTDVAVALHRVYWLDFIYYPVGAGKWFQFRNHRWYEANQGIELRKVISKDFVNRFENIRAILCAQIRDSTDEAFKANAELTNKKLCSIIGKLKTVPFKSNIMKEACEHFKNEKFLGVLDSNSDLTGVTNGILEISNGTVLFRPAKPEDYISMCTNIPYQQHFNWENALVDECLTWLGQCFTDRDLLHHFLKFSSSCLKGRNSDKIFPIFTGEGDNSKSMIVKLFESTFNSYCIKFDISNFTSKATNSSGPTPQLARAKATRVAFVDEPEDDVPMNKGIIKKLVGGDSFFCRMLQDNGGDVQVTFKIILTCNKVPLIPNADKAIKNRTRLFPYLSTWVDDAPETEAEQYRLKRFKKNPFFERRIPVLAPAFLWIMTQYYPYYASEGLPDPTIVTETTAAYWRDNDVYAQFVADNVQEVYTEKGDRDGAARVTLSEIYSEFKTWFRDAFPGNKVPERQIVRSELSTRWGRMTGNFWNGIRLISNEPTAPNMAAAIGGRKPVAGTAGAAPTKAPEIPIMMGPPANIKEKEVKEEVHVKPHMAVLNRLKADSSKSKSGSGISNTSGSSYSSSSISVSPMPSPNHKLGAIDVKINPIMARDRINTSIPRVPTDKSYPSPPPDKTFMSRPVEYDENEYIHEKSNMDHPLDEIFDESLDIINNNVIHVAVKSPVCHDISRTPKTQRTPGTPKIVNAKSPCFNTVAKSPPVQSPDGKTISF